MDRMIKGIDAQQNLSIPDEGRWFVYYMMRQAARNNQWGTQRVLPDLR